MSNSIEEEYNLTGNEKDLVEQATRPNALARERAQTLATLILAKSVQKADESNQRLARWLVTFTAVIAIATVISLFSPLNRFNFVGGVGSTVIRCGSFSGECEQIQAVSAASQSIEEFIAEKKSN